MDPVSGQCNCDSGFVNKISNEKKVKNISIMVNLRIFSSKIQTVRILEEISQHVLGVENWPEKRNFEFFAHAIFKKLLKRNSFRYQTEKNEIFGKKYLFIQNQGNFQKHGKRLFFKNLNFTNFFLEINSEINKFSILWLRGQEEKLGYLCLKSFWNIFLDRYPKYLPSCILLGDQFGHCTVRHLVLL